MKNRKAFAIKNLLFTILAAFVITGMCGFITTDVQAAAKTPQLGAASTSSVKVTKKTYHLKKRVANKTQVSVKTQKSSRNYTKNNVKYLEKKTVITKTTTKYAGLKKTVIKEVETNLVNLRR